jgi:hypothetical protein
MDKHEKGPRKWFGYFWCLNNSWRWLLMVPPKDAFALSLYTFKSQFINVTKKRSFDYKVGLLYFYSMLEPSMSLVEKQFYLISSWKNLKISQTFAFARWWDSKEIVVYVNIRSISKPQNFKTYKIRRRGRCCNSKRWR